MIALHFGAFLFLNLAGTRGMLATVAGLIALVWAGFLFTWASVPYREEPSSIWMLAALAGSNALYITLISVCPGKAWALNLSAGLIGALPLLVALAALPKFSHALRWGLVGLYGFLSLCLLAIQNQPGVGADWALNAVLFTVYFSCALHFLFMYRRNTAGAFITIAGFLAWSAVFVVAPILAVLLPNVHVESEVWNLPKFVVAVGMILLLLEDQIEHNLHLAQHDHLTGLANRRLFQFRLENTLARASRSETQAALLVVDLDRFKQVNDTLGHHVGDLVLKRVADMFSARVRRSDTVARTGGDEFSIILEEPTSREPAMAVVRSLLKYLESPLELANGQSVKVSASVGLAIFPEDAADMEALCIAADLRMYEAKHETGNPDPHGDSPTPTPITAQRPNAPPVLRRVTD
jgi:diguanylate cyclase (GGDEF)-like protein